MWSLALGIAGPIDIAAIPPTTLGGITEIPIQLEARYDNPYDADAVRVDLAVTSPRGVRTVIPAFYRLPHSFNQVDGKEVATPADAGDWAARVSFTQPGTHIVEVTVKDAAGERKSGSRAVEVLAGSAPEFVRISPRDGRYFETTLGKAFFPLGANTCWPGERGVFDYDTWLPKYAANGANLGRLWLSPAWSPLALEKTKVGEFDQAAAARIDRILETARKNGMRIKICIDSYNILRDKDAYNYWEQTPHNRANGGPLAFWSDFWISPEMDRQYRNKLRYLVARYGADPTVFAWEFWNEADLTRDFNPSRAAAWHRRMAKYLKEIDPHKRPITTSFSDTAGVREIDLLEEIDFIQSHHYNSPDLAMTVARTQNRKAMFGKPHYFGEIGADSSGPRADVDPRGHQIHDPIWASIATGAAGAAQPWWWDNLIEPKNLYSIFRAPSKFVQDIDWPGQNFRQVSPTLSFAVPPKTAARDDLVFDNGPASWDRTEFNRPRTVAIDRNGRASGQTPISRILHGTRNHADKHNPIRFNVDLPRPTRFEVVVEGVSGYGGAQLAIDLDGSRVMTRDFADPDDQESTATLNRYDGVYGFEVPAGRHTLVVRNLGRDWMYASYRFRGLVPQTAPPLDAFGTVGERTAVAWVRRKGRTWPAVAVRKQTFPPSPAARLQMKGLARGSWEVELWDTWTGIVQRRTRVPVGNDGNITVPLPPISTDIAVKMTLPR